MLPKSTTKWVKKTVNLGYFLKHFAAFLQIIQELNAAQIDLVHVASICKNAADEKLRQALRRFAERHIPPAAVILLSGDVNFASDLNDLKYR